MLLRVIFASLEGFGHPRTEPEEVSAKSSDVLPCAPVSSVGHHFWWIPVVACYIGGLLGAYVYLFCIELHHPAEEDGEEGVEMPSDTSLECRKDGWANAALEADGYL